MSSGGTFELEAGLTRGSSPNLPPPRLPLMVPLTAGSLRCDEEVSARQASGALPRVAKGEIVEVVPIKQNPSRSGWLWWAWRFEEQDILVRGIGGKGRAWWWFQAFGDDLVWLPGPGFQHVRELVYLGGGWVIVLVVFASQEQEAGTEGDARGAVPAVPLARIGFVGGSPADTDAVAVVAVVVFVSFVVARAVSPARTATVR